MGRGGWGDLEERPLPPGEVTVPLLIGLMPVVFVSPRLNWPLDLVTKRGRFLLVQGAASSSAQALI